jgi:hypothetical protein
MKENSFESNYMRGFMALMLAFIVGGCNLQSNPVNVDAHTATSTPERLPNCVNETRGVFDAHYRNTSVHLNEAYQGENLIYNSRIYIMDHGAYPYQAILELDTETGSSFYAVSPTSISSILPCDVSQLRLGGRDDWAIIRHDGNDVYLVTRTETDYSTDLLGVSEK